MNVLEQGTTALIENEELVKVDVDTGVEIPLSF